MIVVIHVENMDSNSSGKKLMSIENLGTKRVTASVCVCLVVCGGGLYTSAD